MSAALKVTIVSGPSVSDGRARLPRLGVHAVELGLHAEGGLQPARGDTHAVVEAVLAEAALSEDDVVAVVDHLPLGVVDEAALLAVGLFVVRVYVDLVLLVLVEAPGFLPRPLDPLAHRHVLAV